MTTSFSSFLARDVTDWISSDAEFLLLLLKSDTIEGIDKPQSVLLFLLEGFCEILAILINRIIDLGRLQVGQECERFLYKPSFCRHVFVKNA
jgi:hypothetical protein